MKQKRTLNEKTIALLGSPNVGKSTLFNALTGLHQHTGNWSGKTVLTAWGREKTGTYPFLFADLPGACSFFSQSEEEAETRSFLLSGQADLILYVCSACCLERGLILALQCLRAFPRVLLVVTMMDEAKKQGIAIDFKRLSFLLGVPAVGVSCRDSACRGRLLREIDRVLKAPLLPEFFQGGRMTRQPAPSAPLQAADPMYIQNKAPREEALCCTEEELILLVQKAQRICGQTLSRTLPQKEALSRTDRILTGKWTAYPVMFAFLALILWLTIVGANAPSALLSRGFSALETLLGRLFTALSLPAGLRGFLLSGVYHVCTLVISVMLPPMAIFFPLFTLLEDAGFLPRIAYNLDRPFQRCRSCGSQALTMCMGFGCNAAGVVGCRIIQSPREKRIAMLTNSFVPCNGKFPSLIAILTMFFLSGAQPGNSAFCALLLALLISCGVLLTFLCSALLSHTLLRGMPSACLLELPPYHRPQIGKVLIRSLKDRTWFVLKRALWIAAPAGGILWLSAHVRPGGLSLFAHLAGFFDPFARLMGLDGTLFSAFLLGLPANEIVLPIALMGYLSQESVSAFSNLREMKTLLLQHGWTLETAVCAMLFFLFHWPCSTTLLTIQKETGSVKWTLAAFLLPAACGICLCMIVHACWTLGLRFAA